MVPEMGRFLSDRDCVKVATGETILAAYGFYRVGRLLSWLPRFHSGKLPTGFA